MICSLAFGGNGINRLTIAGRLDVATLPQLMPILDAVHEPGPHTVEIDLSRLHWVDDAGVCLLVGLRDWLRSARIRVGIVGLQNQPLAAFRLSQQRPAHPAGMPATVSNWQHG